MPFGGLLSLAGPALSIGSSLGGLFGGTPASQAQGLPGVGNAAGGALGGIGGLGQYNISAGLLPQYQQTAQSMINNPNTSQYFTNAAQTGQQGVQSGQALVNSGLGQLPNVQALMQMGFDPQQALYNRTQNQNQQQNAAILGQSGVAGTPYGAGVQQQANSNFNIDWQNQQLQRAIQGAQGAGGLLNQIGNTTGTGLQQMQAGGALPYNTFMGVNSDALNALSSTGQFGQAAGNQANQSVQDYLAYLGASQGQQQTNLNQANANFGQSQMLGQGLGKGLAGLSSGWSSLNPSFFSGGNTAAQQNSMNILNSGTGGAYYGPGFGP